MAGDRGLEGSREADPMGLVRKYWRPRRAARAGLGRWELQGRRKGVLQISPGPP